MRWALALALVAGLVFGHGPAAFGKGSARPVTMGWQTSCGVDRGSQEHANDTYTFRTSANHCEGGIFHQRSELNSRDISIARKVTYIVETRIAFDGAEGQDFIIFSVHDGRHGCSPPVSLRWTAANRLRFDSDYTRGQGMAGCVENNVLRSAKYSGPPLRRDGTPYDLRLELAFSGGGEFGIMVSINGQRAIAGHYAPPSDAGFVVSRRFYLKHGVYSQNEFPYEMTSRGLRVTTSEP